MIHQIQFCIPIKINKEKCEHVKSTAFFFACPVLISWESEKLFPFYAVHNPKFAPFMSLKMESILVDFIIYSVEHEGLGACSHTWLACSQPHQRHGGWRWRHDQYVHGKPCTAYPSGRLRNPVFKYHKQRKTCHCRFIFTKKTHSTNSTTGCSQSQSKKLNICL